MSLLTARVGRHIYSTKGRYRRKI